MLREAEAAQDPKDQQPLSEEAEAAQGPTDQQP